MNKKASDVYGARKQCINLITCPLCYGCRNFNYIDPSCRECKEENAKFNICNKERHLDELIAKFTQKNKLKFKNDVVFKSNGR